MRRIIGWLVDLRVIRSQQDQPLDFMDKKDVAISAANGCREIRSAALVSYQDAIAGIRAFQDAR